MMMQRPLARSNVVHRATHANAPATCSAAQRATYSPVIRAWCYAADLLRVQQQSCGIERQTIRKADVCVVEVHLLCTHARP